MLNPCSTPLSLYCFYCELFQLIFTCFYSDVLLLQSMRHNCTVTENIKIVWLTTARKELPLKHHSNLFQSFQDTLNSCLLCPIFQLYMPPALALYTFLVSSFLVVSNSVINVPSISVDSSTKININQSKIEC